MRTRPDARQDAGFTLIELLVVIIVIGILAAIAAPKLLNQRSAAHDAAAKADLRNVVEQLRGSELIGALHRGDRDLSIADTYGHVLTLELSPTTAWGVGGSMELGWCVTGYSAEGGQFTATHPLAFDSLAGAWATAPTGSGPCATLPLMSTPSTGGSGTNVDTSTVWNLMRDSSWQGVPGGSSHLTTASYGSNWTVSAQNSAPWMWTTDPSSPAGSRVLTANVATGQTQKGVIIWPEAGTPIVSTTTKLFDGVSYTASAWVKAPAGQPFSFGVRRVDASHGYKGESLGSFTGTGAWQRVSRTVTAGPSVVGQYLALQVQSPSTAAAKAFTLAVVGPQIEYGPNVSKYAPTGP